MAQRPVRAKKKIALAGNPYQVPDHLVLPERLSSVLGVLYQMLYRMRPTPVVYINLAVAVSYARSTDVALDMPDAVADDGRLNRHQPFFAAKADVLSLAGKPRAARACCQTAIDLTTNTCKRQFLQAKVLGLGDVD